MLSQDLRNLAISLGELAGNVPEKSWGLVDRIRFNLRSLADQVGQLEAHFVPGKCREGDSHDNADQS